jgi:hypothetical protein
VSSRHFVDETELFVRVETVFDLRASSRLAPKVSQLQRNNLLESCKSIWELHGNWPWSNIIRYLPQPDFEI